MLHFAYQLENSLTAFLTSFQDDDPEPQATIANAPNIGDLFLGEVEETKQQPNNVRASTNKLQKDVELNEKARYAFVKGL